MAGMIFGTNPFSTVVGQKIEEATDSSLASENWGLNMEICDIVNDSEDGPRDAMKAIKKRMQQSSSGKNPNYTVVMYALTVLETCVKNCGKRFHVVACNKDNVSELVRLIGPKHDPPTVLQEKVLSLIQSWADAFSSDPDLNGVVQVYQDLRHKGIEFPMTDMDWMAPIQTPPRSVTDAPRPASQQEQRSTQTGGGNPAPRSTVSFTLSPDQLGKLRSEMDVVRTNSRILGEMLTELSPGQEDPSDAQLLTDLYDTCKAMQQRVVELLERVSHDELTAELLRVNDDLNNNFLRYARYQKNKSPERTPTAEKETKPLIDLGDDPACVPPPDVTNMMAGMTLAGAPKDTDSDFDMFAQSRGTTYESSKKTGSTYQDNINVDQMSMALGATAENRHKDERPHVDVPFQTETDISEMEQWLQDKPPENDSNGPTEFDRFLAQRATVGESLPSTTPANPAPRPRGPQDDHENSLFVL